MNAAFVRNAGGSDRFINIAGLRLRDPHLNAGIASMQNCKTILSKGEQGRPPTSFPQDDPSKTSYMVFGFLGWGRLVSCSRSFLYFGMRKSASNRDRNGKKNTCYIQTNTVNIVTSSDRKTTVPQKVFPGDQNEDFHRRFHPAWCQDRRPPCRQVRRRGNMLDNHAAPCNCNQPQLLLVYQTEVWLFGLVAASTLQMFL